MNTTQEHRQYIVEQHIGITKEEAEYVNAHKDTPAVKAFMSLYAIQVNGTDPGGLAMLQSALTDVRKEMATDAN